MSDTNPNLMEEAENLMNAALDVAGTPQEAELLEIAAQIYELAGSPEDAEVCRALIDDAR